MADDESGLSSEDEELPVGELVCLTSCRSLLLVMMVLALSTAHNT